MSIGGRYLVMVMGALQVFYQAWYAHKDNAINGCNSIGVWVRQDIFSRYPQDFDVRLLTRCLSDPSTVSTSISVKRCQKN